MCKSAVETRQTGKRTEDYPEGSQNRKKNHTTTWLKKKQLQRPCLGKVAGWWALRITNQKTGAKGGLQECGKGSVK